MANSPDKAQACFRTTIGGQALIEGIMMRGPKKQSIVVRTPEGLVAREEELKLVKERYPILGLPLIRGSAVFIDSMVKGVQALMFSAEYLPEEEAEEPSRFEKWLTEKLGGERAEKAFIGLATALGIFFAVGLFILLPTLLVGLFDARIQSPVARNLIEGAIRVALFLGYLITISRQKDIRRVFSYHGAEHKTIFCYEKGEELTVENVRRQSRFHPRCGTSFLFVVMIISILVFSVASFPNLWLRLLFRILLLPVVVGISYEINRFTGRHDNAFTRFLTAPGLWLQKFTTNEPDDSMIEVGIEALRRVIPEEKGSDRW
ncbi:DUF1385 domain-containing protein [Papillibacter cinnamivorans]|uniref:Uncharacterized conserved protein YqhQ n=1 Tax=Papillibacter cinnamivorans DSM 12816 TaxID=1122930 RepID=A0A1W1ZI35_9FIRM|nr:DUF1385 domain-containing protein [Papillibacter cinnamivorans]SMC48225.1 Uncharacterized conserved protein YqhQ [Papillibacter cinnamivorans DSM 12816]